MNSNWLTSKEIGRQTELSDTTIRRYAGLFQDFIEVKQYGRLKKFAEGSVEIFIAIADLYALGKGTKEIEEYLAARFPKVIDMDEVDSENETPPINHHAIATPNSNDVMSQMQSLGGSLQSMAESLKDLVDQKKQIDEQGKQISELKDTIIKLQNTVLSQRKSWWGFWK